MKKIILSTTCLIIFLAQTALSASIGYVDYQKVVDNYPLAQKYKKEINKKYEEINKYVEKQEKEIKKAKEKQTKIELRNKGLAEVEKKQKNYIEVRKKREAEIANKIKIAADKVRVEKKLDIIIKKDTAVTGGIDVTQDLINRLK
ncbi:MAG: OmpH family outer membrane protein [Cyanobacteria bacterium SIG30]|nr:OmpH family outer membrane protein [Cyanobacteria bacterium SIG30]